MLLTPPLSRSEGGGWEGVACLNSEMPKDVRHNIIRLHQHLMVPVAQDPIAEPFKRHSPCRVLHDTLGVLATIEFDDQSCLWACKVGDVAADGNLSSEPIAFKLPHAQ